MSHLFSDDKLFSWPKRWFIIGCNTSLRLPSEPIVERIFNHINRLRVALHSLMTMSNKCVQWSEDTATQVHFTFIRLLITSALYDEKEIFRRDFQTRGRFQKVHDKDKADGNPVATQRKAERSGEMVRNAGLSNPRLWHGTRDRSLHSSESLTLEHRLTSKSCKEQTFRRCSTEQWRIDAHASRKHVPLNAFTRRCQYLRWCIRKAGRKRWTARNLRSNKRRRRWERLQNISG